MESKACLDDSQILANHSRKVEFKPIFIIGDHRSGTTLLYKLLIMSGKVNYLSSYNVIKYDQILSNHFNNTEIKEKKDINNYLTSKNIENRGMDLVEVNADLPEEYGFILRRKSGTSHLNEENHKVLKEVCAKLSILNPHNHLILLKNPYDSDNISYIKSVFPNAKFIITTRSMRAISRSKRAAASYLFKSFSPYTSLLSDVYTEYFNNNLMRYFILFYYSNFNVFARLKIFNDIKKNQEKMFNNIDKNDTKTFFVTSYEKICENTNLEINSINDFMGIGHQSIDYSSVIYK